MIQPLRIDEILEKLYCAIEKWGEPHKASVSIARDPFHVLEILAENPQGFRVIVHWAGDENASDIMERPLADHKIQIVFSYNLGLTAKPDLALIQGQQNRPALYKLLDDLRALVLGLAFPDFETAEYCIYTGTEPVVTPDGIPLAAYRLKFHLIAAVAVPPQPQPV